MGRPRSPRGYAASRYNRLTNGVMIHAILPSRGVQRCPLSDDCPCKEDPALGRLCVAGDPCPWESWFHERYIESGRECYQRCLDWMSFEQRDRILGELSILSLRRRRLSALVAKQGMFREKRHRVSGLVYGIEATLGVGRYATAIDHLFYPLVQELLFSPDERTDDSADAEAPLVLPFSRAACERSGDTRSADTVVEPQQVPHWEPVAAPRRWDHAPGMPRDDT